MEQIEVWLPIRGYEGLYAVSNWGRVKSYERLFIGKGGGLYPIRERIIIPRKSKNGYTSVILCKYKKKTTYSIHKLVAQAFIPNPNNLPQVLHRDDNRANNRVQNLFWGTQADNMRDCASKNRQGIKKRPVVAINPDGGQYEFESIMDAARRTGIAADKICKCCKLIKGYRTAGGYKWKYAIL